MKKCIRKNEQGFTLIEVLIAASVGVILVLGFTSTLVAQMREMRWLLNKTDVNEAKNNLVKTLQNGAVCSWQFKDKQFNAANVSATQPSETEIALDKVYEGTSPTSKVAVETQGRISSSNQNLLVSKIAVTNIVATGIADHFAGDLTVTFADSSTTRAFQPLKVALKFKTSSVSPSVKKITECEQETAAGSSDGSCDWNADFNADVANGSAVCTQPLGKDVKESEVSAAEHDDYVWIEFTNPRIARRKKLKSIPDSHWVPSGTYCRYDMAVACGTPYLESMSCAGGVSVPVYKSYQCSDQSG